MCVCVCVYIYTHTHTHIIFCLYIYVCVCVCVVCVCVFVCLCVCVCVCVCVCKMVVQKVKTVRAFRSLMSTLQHPACISDLAPSDVHLFLKIEGVCGWQTLPKRWGSEECLQGVAKWTGDGVYREGIQKLATLYDKCLIVGGQTAFTFWMTLV